MRLVTYGHDLNISYEGSTIGRTELPSGKHELWCVTADGSKYTLGIYSMKTTARVVAHEIMDFAWGNERTNSFFIIPRDEFLNDTFDIDDENDTVSLKRGKNYEWGWYEEG